MHSIRLTYCYYAIQYYLFQNFLVKIVDGGLYFIFFLFIFILLFFSFSFNFLFLEQLRLGVSVTLSHQSQLDGVVTRLITREVEGTRTK